MVEWKINLSCGPNRKHVIFGLYYDLTHFSAINYIILLGKMYIYRQKMNENTIYFNYFLNELKFKLDIETTILWNQQYTCTVEYEMCYYTRLTSHISFIQSNCFSLSLCCH